MASTTTKEILTDLSPILKVYTDGTVERFYSTPYVPPSPEDPTDGVASKDVIISPTVSARLYLPKPAAAANSKLPIIVYYHGGGFCVGSALSSLDHTYMNALTPVVGALVVSVEYRLAPEHLIPVAYEDSWEALSWVCSHVLDKFDLPKDGWVATHADFTKLYIAGDSAGGNIAHHMGLRAGTESLPGDVKIRGAILSHPFFLGSDPVEGENKDKPVATLLERIWPVVYPSAPGGIDNPWINPLAEGGRSLSGMGCSKIQVLVSEKDMLTARAKAYAERLRKCGWGGEVEVVDIEEEDHCFHIFVPKSPKALDLMNQIASFVSQ